MEQRFLSNSEAAEASSVSCSTVEELLYLFISDELEDAEAKMVSAHLFACAQCRKALAETVKVAGALSTALPKVPQRYYSINN